MPITYNAGTRDTQPEVVGAGSFWQRVSLPLWEGGREAENSAETPNKLSTMLERETEFDHNIQTRKCTV